MQFGDDERAAAIQIGAVLLFGMLIISMATYQATVVPDQNKGIEFNHNQKVQGQMQDLRNAVVSTPGGGNGGSVTVDLGTTYPSRTLFVNPGPPSGTLRTVGTNEENVNVTIDNATATGETGDVWTGDARNFTTGALVYQPRYHEYQNPPRTVYEHSLLYNQFRDENLTVSDQTIVNDRQITLITLDGNLSENGMDSASVTARPISASSNTVAVEADDGPINITVPTRLDNDTWADALGDQYVSNGGHIAGQYYEDVNDEPYGLLTIELEEGETYDLQMAKVGVGSGASTESGSELYVTDPTVQGTTASAQVRDRYNNPVSGTNVTVYVDGTETTTEVSNADGRVSYDANSGDTVKFSIGSNQASNVTVTVPDNGGSGSGSGGAYQIDWQNPGTNSSNSGLDLSNCSNESCTWDVGASGNDEIALTGIANDQIENVNVDFRVNNSTVGTVDPTNTTNTGNGRVWTNLTATENGTVGVYVLSSGSSDRIDITVENYTTGGGPTISSFTATNPSGQDVQVSFDSSEQLSTIQVDISGAETGSLTTADFSETANADGTYTYTGTYVGSSDGEYTATLVTAENTNGKNGANGESDTVVVDTTSPNFTALNATAINDGTGSGGGGSNDAEKVRFGYETTDNIEADRVRMVVYDNNGAEVANETRTVTNDTHTVTLSSRVSVNGNSDVSVEVTAFDTSGNGRQCTGAIQDVGSANMIEKQNGDFTCSNV